MIEKTAIKPKGDVEELLRSVGYDRTEAEKIQDELVLKEFSKKVKEQGYTLSLLNDFAARLRTKNYDPNYIAGAIAVLLSRRILEAKLEAKKEFTLERQIRLIEKLPTQIAKAVAQELEKVSIYTTSKFWSDVVTVDLTTARTSPQLLGDFPGADCIVALPDSTGTGILRLDSATAYPYPMRSVYRKVRGDFNTLYIENGAQAGLYLYLAIGKGDITTEPWT